MKKQVPRPPLSGRSSGKSKLRRVPSSAGRKFFNKNMCLPPVGSASSTRATATSSGKSSADRVESSVDVTSDDLSENKEEANDTIAPLVSANSTVKTEDILSPENRSLPGSASSSRKKLEPDVAKLFRLSSVKEDEPIQDCETAKEGAATSSPTTASTAQKPQQQQLQSNSQEALKAILENAEATAQKKSPYKWEISQEVLLKDTPKPHPPTSPKKDAPSATGSASYTYKDSTTGRKSRSSRASIERLLSETGEMLGASNKSGTSRPTTSSTTLEALKESLGRPTTSSKRVGAGTKGGVILESLNPSEVRAVSGALSNFVRSSSRASRNGFIKDGRIPTPESRLVVSGVNIVDDLIESG